MYSQTKQALEYAAKGYPVFPVKANDKRPATRNGFKDATVDLDTIEAWFEGEYNGCNIGIPTQGLLVIDIEGGNDKWLSNLDKFGPAPISITPSGGRHIFYKSPDGKSYRNTAKKLDPLVDTRADGGYVLAPYSAIDDVEYEWEVPLPRREMLTEPPQWVQDGLDKHDVSHANPYLGTSAIVAGERNHTLTKIGGYFRRAGFEEHDIVEFLRHVNVTRCTPPVPDKELATIARSVSKYVPDTITSIMVTEPVAPIDMSVVTSKDQCIDTPPLRVPGLIGSVMDYSLTTAPYPNEVMAFCGALALMSFLTGRKIRDPQDNRTNLYVIGLGFSGVGKDWPRKTNVKIIRELGLGHMTGDNLASGQGLQDAMFLQPCRLFQTDEIDNLLTAMAGTDGQHDALMSTLLTLYSSSNNSVFRRPLSNRAEQMGSIDQPSLTLFGTATPSTFYGSLSEKMLCNGLFSRSLIFESGNRADGQDARAVDVPDDVLDQCRQWAAFAPGGDLASVNPVPVTVPYTANGRQALREYRTKCDIEYRRYHDAEDPVGTSVWARAPEHVYKLCLLYAASVYGPLDAQIDESACKWAIEVVEYQVRRMLSFNTQSQMGGSSPFRDLCSKFLRALSEGPQLHSMMLKNLHVKSSDLKAVAETLVERGDIEIGQTKTGQRMATCYRKVKFKT